jgi:DUF1680 family protein
VDEPPVELRWSRRRVPFVTSFCCPPNLARTLASVGGCAYGKSDGTVWVNLYGSSTLDATWVGGNRFRLEQKTNYPWDGDIRITIRECASAPVRLKLRIPGWAKSATLTIDGEPANVKTIPGSYATIERTWTPGTTVDLELPMPPQLIEAHPLVEETRNHLAVKRGPLVYCLESVDLPGGTSVADVRVPANVKLQPRFDAGLLGGVTVLEGEFVARSSDAWEGKLYREFRRPDAKPIQAALIPYYAWANRDRSEMSVWLPLD